MYHIVIPARYGSTRLPAKALADINGKPLVYWVWRQAMQSKAVSVTVATDDIRIQEAMMLHGAEVLITDPDHPSGTDRLAEVARLKDWDSSAIVVNLQGDEPLMPVANLEQVADLLNGHPEASIATLCEPIDTADAFQDASVVKVVADASGRAQYFSRSPIPHVRGADEAFVPSEARRHVGLYAYRVSFLADFASQPMAPFEQLESLEQLRALHCGHEIRIADAIEPVPAGVDTQKDLDAVRRLMAPLMLRVEANFQLGSLNTLKLECIAECYAHVSTTGELQEALGEARQRSLNINVLGGGSNLILNRFLPGMTIHMGLKGRELLEESADDVVVRLQAGEEWHETVLWANAEGYFGLENLALIPGSVGAAPVQNIGAYGVEIAQMIECVHVVDSRNGDLRALSAAQCCFSYRDSLFKAPEGKHLIITAIDLRLSKHPVVNTSYPALREVVPADAATPSDVLAAVVAIRQSKLPDPGIEANVGSFFKNPIVDREIAEHLKGEYPDMPQYPVDANTVKLSAAWMIDQLGWRGVGECGVSVSEKHALVVINKSARYASEVIEFTNKITSSVTGKYRVSLDREPELVGSDQRP